ncbi:YeeE/YedE family protein [Pseudenhygromyxa sp. WMMC2535]|nr:YeeE/YedE family protein [Pseudenhygromyxa sp. WMMC2535]
MRQNITAFLSGLLFAIGLGLAGMTNPNKVLNFLDVSGSWDPSLAFVMGGAILVYLPVYRITKGKDAPLWNDRFHWPTKTDIDARLVIGATMFGVGWGLVGFCPGPAIVSTATLSSPVLVFFAAMIVGMLSQRVVVGRIAASKAKREGSKPADCGC